jgi:3-oxoacyl-[acyl-carrier protein] reductase
MTRVLREGAFEGETHIVTGAAQGIGHAVATALAEHGAQVTLVDLDAGRLKEAADEIAKVATVAPLTVAANVTSEQDVKHAVATTLEATGAINGVVNVAGITKDARIVKKSYEDFRTVMAVHVGGTFLFTREVAAQHWHPLFKANGNEPLSDGVNRFVLNFSSMSARNGNIGQIDYTAAKGAIESMTKTAAREFSAYRVRVNAIAPGPVNTPMLAALGEAGIASIARGSLVGAVARPEQMANVICALADPLIGGYITGEVVQVNGGLYLD